MHAASSMRSTYQRVESIVFNAVLLRWLREDKAAYREEKGTVEVHMKGFDDVVWWKSQIHRVLFSM